MQSPKAVVNHYNDVSLLQNRLLAGHRADNPLQLLQRAADFYATLDTSYDSMSASGSDTSYRSTPERRVSSATSILAQVKGSIPDKLEVSHTGLATHMK